MMRNIYLEDLKTIQTIIPNLAVLFDCSILVTGASGMIGKSIVDFLLLLNDTKKVNMKIYAACRTKASFDNAFQDNNSRSDLLFFEYNALIPFETDFHWDYIIHAASPATPKSYNKQPVETMGSNYVGINTLLNYCANNKNTRLLYVSSSEVYGKKEEIKPYKEDDYGFVDILNYRSCYPIAKRAAETLCTAYHKEYDVDFVVVRPGHVFGPTMKDDDDRAASQFLREGACGHNIIMKSEGTQIRSHCYVVDCVSAIITVLLNGETGCAYNISNPKSVSSIREFAMCVSLCTGVQVVFEVPTREESSAFNPMNNSSLDSSLLEALGWRGLYDLREGIEHTLESL